MASSKNFPLKGTFIKLNDSGKPTGTAVDVQHVLATKQTSTLASYGSPNTILSRITIGGNACVLLEIEEQKRILVYEDTGIPVKIDGVDGIIDGVEKPGKLGNRNVIKLNISGYGYGGLLVDIDTMAVIKLNHIDAIVSEIVDREVTYAGRTFVKVRLAGSWIRSYATDYCMIDVNTLEPLSLTKGWQPYLVKDLVNGYGNTLTAVTHVFDYSLNVDPRTLHVINGESWWRGTD